MQPSDLSEANAEALETVCMTCGIGILDATGERDTSVRAFEKEHSGHGDLKLVLETIFRSDYLKRGFTDVNRPDLEPITTSFGGSAQAPTAAQSAPFGKPVDREASAAAARRSARALMGGGRSPVVVPPPAPIIALRPSWDQTFMDIAFVLARRGTCSRRKVGAVIVNGTRIISDGYNGAPSGLRHCNHLRDGEDMLDGHCVVAEHAERNALLYAGREARGGALYVTCTPCLACCRMMVTAGIERIVYADEYRADRLIDELCAAAGIFLDRISGTI